MGRRKKEQVEPSGPKGAPDWIVTFTDMISLLVTFFVLMMTFSSMVTDDRLKVDSILSGQRGIIEAKSDVLAELSMDDILSSTDIVRGSAQPHTRPADKLLDSIEEMGQKKTDEHLEVDFDAQSDGLVIEFGTDECFEPGSARVPESLAKSLGEIARVLENYPNLVVVEGFTDGAHHATSRYPDADAIAFARAEAAALIMRTESGLAPEIMQVASHGDRRPRADDETPEGRRANRRVQLRVLSLSKVRATHMEGLEREGRGGR